MKYIYIYVQIKSFVSNFYEGIYARTDAETEIHVYFPGLRINNTEIKYFTLQL